MLVDYTTLLNRPSVSVEASTQQGVESVVEVTPVSGVASDGSSVPSLQLLLLRELRVVAQTATGVVVVVSVRVSSSSRNACGDAGASLAEVQGRLPPRLHLLLRRGGRVLLLLLPAYHRAAQRALHKARGQNGNH